MQIWLWCLITCNLLNRIPAIRWQQQLLCSLPVCSMFVRAHRVCRPYEKHWNNRVCCKGNIFKCCSSVMGCSEWYFTKFYKMLLNIRGIRVKYQLKCIINSCSRSKKLSYSVVRSSRQVRCRPASYRDRCGVSVYSFSLQAASRDGGRSCDLLETGCKLGEGVWKRFEKGRLEGESVRVEQSLSCGVVIGLLPAIEYCYKCDYLINWIKKLLILLGSSQISTYELANHVNIPWEKSHANPAEIVS
jgi:hypothetical protein